MTFMWRLYIPVTNRPRLARIFISHWPLEGNRMGACAQITLDRSPAADKEDLITVSIGYGYDIGIASAWSNHNYPYSPARWRRRLAPST
jgi:hypothetical protein